MIYGKIMTHSQQLLMQHAYQKTRITRPLVGLLWFAIVTNFGVQTSIEIIRRQRKKCMYSKTAAELPRSNT